MFCFGFSEAKQLRAYVFLLYFESSYEHTCFFYISEAKVLRFGAWHTLAIGGSEAPWHTLAIGGSEAPWHTLAIGAWHTYTSRMRYARKSATRYARRSIAGGAGIPSLREHRA